MKIERNNTLNIFNCKNDATAKFGNGDGYEVSKDCSLEKRPTIMIKRHCEKIVGLCCDRECVSCGHGVIVIGV